MPPLPTLWDFTMREDSERYSVSPKYVRDKEGREIDFAWIENGKLRELVEVKFSDESVHKPLLYYAQRLNPERATQIVFTIRRSFSKANLNVMSPMERFGELLSPNASK
jgi:hypothetical protein